MDRRNFIKFLSASIPLLSCGCSDHRKLFLVKNPEEEKTPELDDIAGAKPGTPKVGPRNKSAQFDEDFPDDIFCSNKEHQIIQRLVRKLRGVQSYVGNGHFNLVGMDEFFLHSKYAPQIQAVTMEEKKYLESLFHFDAKKYGFYGDKVFRTLTENISKSATVKVPNTGHYLRKGKSLDTYVKMKRDIGHSVILTSGVRAMAKQFHLFLEKTLLSQGNYSRASRSLAPPGHSFHGLNDFDIGKVGLGLSNFTDDFAQTREFKALADLGYVDIRYKEANTLGVRFEPWHIKI
jgi:D-alanyl-D-alanine carboxypeptidase